jgi:hypothetical protein
MEREILDTMNRNLEVTFRGAYERRGKTPGVAE